MKKRVGRPPIGIEASTERVWIRLTAQEKMLLRKYRLNVATIVRVYLKPLQETNDDAAA